ncbi:MAG: MerR family transcriptional regulator [Caldimonas sp.]
MTVERETDSERADPGARFRSAAVARMLRMPVATLRIWESRYGVTDPQRTAAGHRQYSAADVQRLALLKQLTDLGHAIGSLATLPVDALKQAAATHASVLAGATRHAGDRRGDTEPGQPQPRRYDDATLAGFAGLSTTIACECPTHIAEIVIRLSNFELYSAECQQLGPTDAELHGYLQRVAGTARALFESALERVALHEGLVLPTGSRRAGRGAAASPGRRRRVRA